MKFTITLIYFFISCLVFGHAELFQLSNSEYLGNNKLQNVYGFEFHVNYTASLHIQELGLDFFSVGEDNSATLLLTVFEKKSKLKLVQKSVLIKDIDFKTAILPLDYFFQVNKSYIILIENDTNLIQNKDNSIVFFKPRILSAPINDKFISISSILTSSQSNFPFISSQISPFIHIGITNLTKPGINLLSTEVSGKYPSNSFVKHYKTKFCVKDSSFFISKVGFNYFDVGANNLSSFIFKVLDSNGTVIKSSDQYIESVKKQPLEFDFSFLFQKKTIYFFVYERSIEVDTDNVILLFKPRYLPFSDTTNRFEFLDSFTDDVKDSLFPAIYLINFEDQIPLLVQKKSFSPCYVKSFFQDSERRCELVFDESLMLFNYDCFDISGVSYKQFIYLDKNRFVFYPNNCPPQLYYFFFNNELVKFYI